MCLYLLDEEGKKSQFSEWMSQCFLAPFRDSTLASINCCYVNYYFVNTTIKIFNCFMPAKI